MNRLLKSLNFFENFPDLLKSASGLVMGVVILFSNLSTAHGEFGSIVDVGMGGDMYFTNNSANNGQGFVNLLIQNTWSRSQIWLDVGAGGLVGETATSYVKMPQFY